MIEIVNLNKSFGKLTVLKDLTVVIPKGKITAILGPNASGKSTLIKAILGLVKPQSGDILLEGESILGKWDYRQKIGYMPQMARFPENLTVRELFSLLLDLRQKEVLRDRELYDKFELTDLENRPLRVLSGGTRQKINAALALMFDPPLLILDEPSVGMDPVSSAYLKDKIRRDREGGKTVMITSHIMSEVEELADHIVFLLEGKIHFQGSLKDLRTETGEVSLERGIVKLVERIKNGSPDLENIQI